MFCTYQVVRFITSKGIFTCKNSSQGQMVQPWCTWTVKFQKVEMVPRVAKLHLALYCEACVVSRPHPFLMASSRITGAQTYARWWLSGSYNCPMPTKCQIGNIVILYSYMQNMPRNLMNIFFHSILCLHTIWARKICVYVICVCNVWNILFRLIALILLSRQMRTVRPLDNSVCHCKVIQKS